MGTPGGLADCSVNHNGMWYNWYNGENSQPSGWENHVGFITKCSGDKDKACGSKHKLVGRTNDNMQGRPKYITNNWSPNTAYIQTTYKDFGSGDKYCPAVSNSLKLCNFRGARYICQKKEEEFSRDWQKCCSSNEKWSPKDGCNPYWYKDGDTFSNDCKNLCLGKKSHGLTPDIKETLKNDYNNGICLDVLKSNVDETELRKFCQSDDAYNSETGEPVKDYTNICGCYYPQDYYDKLIQKLKELYPELPEGSYNDRTCFSTLCANSKLKSNISTEQCPDQYFLRCINNAKFEAGGDMSGIELGQGNDCNIYVEKGDFPFCGRTCDNDDNCVNGQCNSCIDGVCKNKDSVSCSNYTCPSNKIIVSNAYCVGDSSTCNEDDCCVDTSGGSGSGSPSSGTNNKNLWGKVLLYGGIVLIIIGIIGLIYSTVILYNKTSNVPLVYTLSGGGRGIIYIFLMVFIYLIIGGSLGVYYGNKMINDNSSS